MKRLIAILITAFTLTACGHAVIEHGYGTAMLATPTPNFTCSYFKEYDSLNACQTATHANCSSEFQNFPTGGIGLCYKPVAGFEACAAPVPTWDWIYTTYGAWCDTGVGSGATRVFQQSRSLVGCSSAICNCDALLALSQTCPGPGPYTPACPTGVVPAPPACP